MKTLQQNSFPQKNLKIIFTIFLLTISANSSNAFYIFQDFDNTSFPPPGWVVTNTSGYNMVRTSYCSGYGTGASSAVADFYDYPSGSFVLTTSSFPNSGSGDSLIFDHAYAPATNESDRLEIYTSSDNGNTWTLLITLNGGANGPLRTAPPTYDLFVPTASQWATKSYQLPSGTNMIRFTAITGYGNSLYLDNIKVGSRFNNDIGMSSISDPKWGITPQSVAPKTVVRNYGNSPQSFQVTLMINPGGYTNTQSVSNLSPGQTQIVTFNNFNFSNTGIYTIKAFTSFAGDQNSVNDTLTNSLIVTNSPRNLVLEFCTGTWCQWCPCGEDEVHNLHAAYPSSVILAYHGAASDPWKSFTGNSIISLLGFPGYPSGLIDRRLGSNNGWGSFFFDGEYRLSQSPEAAVDIRVTNENYNTATRQFTVNLNATALSNLSGQYKVNYVITEDNLVYPQTGNSSCPGSSTWEHDWVVRTIANNVSGENVNSGNWNSGQIIPLTLTTTLDSAWAAVNCSYHVFIFKDNGQLSISEVQQGISGEIMTTGINPSGENVPSNFELSQNYPNPFNPVTNIHFSIPHDGNVSLKIYNVLGKLVEVYVDEFMKAGVYNAEVDASNYPSGIYFYRLTSGSFSETKKMNVIK